MEAIPVLFYVIICIVIGHIGNKRSIGAAMSFVLCLLLSPIIGLIITLCSKKKDAKLLDNDKEKEGIDYSSAIIARTNSSTRMLQTGSCSPQKDFEMKEDRNSAFIELLAECNPSNFMQPYDYEKIKVANELYNALQQADLTDEQFVQIELRAKNELEVSLSCDALYSLLCSACIPSRFMNPYDHEKVSKANELYFDVLSHKNSLQDLQRILSIALEEKFFEEGLLIQTDSSKNNLKQTQQTKNEIDGNQSGARSSYSWINDDKTIS